MVQGYKFHGLSTENPIDHLYQFDKLCEMVKIDGLSEDALKFCLFPVSLGGKAQEWEKYIPSEIVTTWSEFRKAFLTKFFSNSRTARWRNEISNFTQQNTESFREAWERIERYTKQCRHHGFSDEFLLSIFYRGVTPKYRTLLDIGSHGTFLEQDAQHGMTLVKNLAESDASYGEDYEQ